MYPQTRLLLSHVSTNIHNTQPHLYIYIYIYIIQTHTHTHTHTHIHMHTRTHAHTNTQMKIILIFSKNSAYLKFFKLEICHKNTTHTEDVLSKTTSIM